MNREHWADGEIKSLSSEKKKLDLEARECIWDSAFSASGNKRRLSLLANQSIKMENQVGRSEFFRNFGESVRHQESGLTSREEIIRFKQALLRGACEYLSAHPPSDNRITATEIFRVLNNGTRFGGLITSDQVRRWIVDAEPGFEVIPSYYAIVKKTNRKRT